MQGLAQPVADLEVAVDDAHVVEVLDGVQDLTDELAGVFLCVEAFLDDAVEELPAGHPGKRHISASDFSLPHRAMQA